MLPNSWDNLGCGNTTSTGYLTKPGTQSGWGKLSWKFGTLFQVAIHFRTYTQVAFSMDVYILVSQQNP